MDDDLTGAPLLHGLGTLGHQRPIVEAQPHLGRHRHLRGHGTAHSIHHAHDLLGILQQRCTAAMAVDHLGRTAEIQIDALGSQARQIGSVLGHADGVGAQQLRPHRHPGQRPAAIAQLGHGTQIDLVRQQRAADANELGHAAVRAAHPGQHIAQHKIQQPFHGRKQQSHFRFKSD
ncbi:hypothetical protein SDC9_188007 [bioreactor metagenome]|uniref:Uncharacterized protein n=1 Tax=bioreactor metagenome TaxID=1076179 RepID=A0A645HQF3_9ZZZZ